MSDVKGQMSAMFQILLQTIDGLTEDELSELMKGSGKLVFQAVNSPRSQKKTQRHRTEKAVDIATIVQALLQVSSREDGYGVLEKSDKPHLTALAQEFKIHVLKSDTRLKITKKIVESIIGSKLRSDAIRETSLKGKYRAG